MASNGPSAYKDETLQLWTRSSNANPAGMHVGEVNPHTGQIRVADTSIPAFVRVGENLLPLNIPMDSVRENLSMSILALVRAALDR